MLEVLEVDLMDTFKSPVLNTASSCSG